MSAVVVGWAESSRPTSGGVVGLEDSAHPTMSLGSLDITFVTLSSDVPAKHRFSV